MLVDSIPFRAAEVQLFQKRLDDSYNVIDARYLGWLSILPLMYRPLAYILDDSSATNSTCAKEDWWLCQWGTLFNKWTVPAGTYSQRGRERRQQKIKEQKRKRAAELLHEKRRKAEDAKKQWRKEEEEKEERQKAAEKKDEQGRKQTGLISYHKQEKKYALTLNAAKDMNSTRSYTVPFTAPLATAAHHRHTMDSVHNSYRLVYTNDTYVGTIQCKNSSAKDWYDYSTLTRTHSSECEPRTCCHPKASLHMCTVHRWTQPFSFNLALR